MLPADEERPGQQIPGKLAVRYRVRYALPSSGNDTGFFV
jgi:hypothetical protein